MLGFSMPVDYPSPVRIDRPFDKSALAKFMAAFPVTAILWPRQSGKTTLAREFAADHFLDLENPRDAAMLTEPQLALEPLSGLIVIDEIRRAPELFPLLRHMVDTRQDQRYPILGSASRELIRQSTESPAGRVAYFELGGFRPGDVRAEHWRDLWLRGGLSPAYTTTNEQASYLWREQYVATFLERDIPQLGISIPAATLSRFWTMLCHYHGSILNHSELAWAFGVSDMTVRRYLDILESTFMIRLLQPWLCQHRQTAGETPRALRSGLGSAAHPARDPVVSGTGLSQQAGRLLEGVRPGGRAARTIGKHREKLALWATHSGAQVDLFWQEHGRNWGVEIKYTDATRLTPSMASAVKDLEIARLWVLYPGDKVYPLAPAVTTLPFTSPGNRWCYE
ncbi:MAG: ATP-binding protein [Syntrophobacteraceae bacterium]|nr:ATP-binding protein [Syntrophobacteraceae bacterium]